MQSYDRISSDRSFLILILILDQSLVCDTGLLPRSNILDTYTLCGTYITEHNLPTYPGSNLQKKDLIIHILVKVVGTLTLGINPTEVLIVTFGITLIAGHSIRCCIDNT